MNEIVYWCRQLSNCTVIAIFAELILHSTYMYTYITHLRRYFAVFAHHYYCYCYHLQMEIRFVIQLITFRQRDSLCTCYNHIGGKMLQPNDKLLRVNCNRLVFSLANK